MSWFTFIKDNYETLKTAEGVSILLTGVVLGTLLYYVLHRSALNALQLNEKLLKEPKKMIDKLKKKVSELSDENQGLKSKNFVMKLSAREVSKKELSSFAIVIMQECKKLDVTEFRCKRISQNLSLTEIEFKQGIEDLKKKELIHSSEKFGFGDRKYSLASNGLKYVAGLKTSGDA